MRDYIDREQAIRAITTAALPDKTADGVPIANGKRSVTDCIRRLKAIPAADVRPVVTCADCKFWDRERISCEGLARCNTGESGVRYRNRNDFCSRGVKKEES